MKKCLIGIFCYLVTSPLIFGQDNTTDYERFITKANLLLKEKDYANSAMNFSLAFKSNGWKGTSNDRYNAARAWSMANIHDSAFFCLERIINHLGYSNLDEITSEVDFTPLHTDNRWHLLIAQVKQNKLPAGWHRAGSKSTSYKMYVDSNAGKEGKKVLTIQSIENKIDGFGTLMQSFFPENYLGKRIKLSGYMKSKDVISWAGFWMRVDQNGSDESLAFDNMRDRPIKGTTEWIKYEIVLDIPKNANNISFGALMDNSGQIWFEKLNFEVVSKSVPLTGLIKNEPNLNFDK